jgi:hypothetical protein
MLAVEKPLPIIEWASGLVSNSWDLIEKTQSSSFRLFSGF